MEGSQSSCLRAKKLVEFGIGGDRIKGDTMDHRTAIPTFYRPKYTTGFIQELVKAVIRVVTEYIEDFGAQWPLCHHPIARNQS